ncbi:hypothetical protein IE53DRAFT_359947 [Violaceomyces palustris]|uniref:Uncharacterized protein n=1 Tax=Violaceomyces palustris TaxID=1673888 RepID=A0ACD0P5Y7_9BASI|nr:hypothetical protein IE53DRAFT_359947 [Violaceomyces palustris]
MEMASGSASTNDLEATFAQPPPPAPLSEAVLGQEDQQHQIYQQEPQAASPPGPAPAPFTDEDIQQPQQEQQQQNDQVSNPNHQPNVQPAPSQDEGQPGQTRQEPLQPSQPHADDLVAAPQGEGGSPVKVKKERAKPRPRAKSQTKITRHRKITSCLQCRERKQKCDRVKPVCGNCLDNDRGEPCHYVDEETDRNAVNGSLLGDSGALSSPAGLKRKFLDTGGGPYVSGRRRHGAWRGSRETDRLYLEERLTRKHIALVHQQQMISATVGAGKDKSKDFGARVNAARAAAIAGVIFDSNLKLPTAQQVSTLLYTYKTQIELFTNVVIIDINLARIQSFLRWWHSKPTTLPADPPLVPLLLVILALSLQARRTTGEDPVEAQRDATDPLPAFECSDEKTLLEVSGDCIDALQIACPSAWSSAFQAPIDLIKASLLRGIWHLNELNLQFAGSCFATTTRLAHAAGLHRDPAHWSGMRIEEAQARRNLWWNVVCLEASHASRLNQPPSLSHESFDTRYPDDHLALCALYERAGLADADPSQVILPPGATTLLPRMPTRVNFDYHWARFRLNHIALRHSRQLFRFNTSEVIDPDVSEDYEKWKDELPSHLRSHFDSRGAGSLRPSPECMAKLKKKQPVKGVFDPNLNEEHQQFLQRCMLEVFYHQSIISIHRPYIDERGAWRPPDSVQKSLEICLISAETVVRIASDMLAVNPPFYVYNFCIYLLFNSGLILAIHCKLDSNSLSSMALRPALNQAILELSDMSSNSRLGNVAEQAGRYAATLKEMLDGAQTVLPTIGSSAPAIERRDGKGMSNAKWMGQGRDLAQDSNRRRNHSISDGSAYSGFEGGHMNANTGGDQASSMDGGSEAYEGVDLTGSSRLDPNLPTQNQHHPQQPESQPQDPNSNQQVGEGLWADSMLDRPFFGFSSSSLPGQQPTLNAHSQSQPSSSGIGSSSNPSGGGGASGFSSLPSSGFWESGMPSAPGQTLQYGGPSNWVPVAHQQGGQGSNQAQAQAPQASSYTYQERKLKLEGNSAQQQIIQQSFEPHATDTSTGAEAAAALVSASGLKDGRGGNDDAAGAESYSQAILSNNSGAGNDGNANGNGAENGQDPGQSQQQAQGQAQNYSHANLVGMWSAWEQFSQMLNHRD